VAVSSDSESEIYLRRGNLLPFVSHAVSKYWHVIKVGIQNTLTYRVNFLFRSAFGLIPLMATIYLWRTIYRDREGGAEVAGYTLAAMTSYYVLVTIVDALTAVAEDDWQIAADIRDGNISQFLLKPVDYLTYRLCLFLSGRLIYVTVACVPVGIFIWWLREYFVAPAGAAAFGWFMLSVALTGLLQFFISYTMALLAFWVLEVSTFIFILYAFEYAAGGHLFPLNILPAPTAEALNYTPFPYQLFFPVSIYLGQATGEMLWRGLVIQALWTVVFYLLARLVWNRGIRKYAAFGG
jgi:ABC-2 type transport system permease protein